MKKTAATKSKPQLQPKTKKQKVFPDTKLVRKWRPWTDKAKMLKKIFLKQYEDIDQLNKWSYQNDLPLKQRAKDLESRVADEIEKDLKWKRQDFKDTIISKSAINPYGMYRDFASILTLPTEKVNFTNPTKDEARRIILLYSVTDIDQAIVWMTDYKKKHGDTPFGWPIPADGIDIDDIKETSDSESSVADD